MVTKLSIDGSIFDFGKEITSFIGVPQDSVVSVDWGGGDIDILTGDLPETTVDYADFLGGQCVGMLYRVKLFFLVLLIENDASLYNTAVTVEAIGQISSVTLSNNTFKVISDSGAITRNINFGAATYNVPYGTEITPRWSDQVDNCGDRAIGYVVTTSTSQTSQRTTSTPPIVTTESGECLLTVTFSDGTIWENTYPICPIVAELEDCCNYPKSHSSIANLLSKIGN